MACKKCEEQLKILTRQDVEIQAEASFPIYEEKIDHFTYNFRKSICYQCEHLVQDTTCSLCGCYVAVRAMFKDRICPDEKNHWEIINKI